MRMLGVVICEDNLKQREKITKYMEDLIMIEELDAELKLSTENPDKVISYLEENKSNNIYFLDVDLSHRMNGIMLAKKIREYDPRGFIVFVTTHLEMSYLTFTYKVEAMDYIIKDDFDNIRDRIKECIKNAIERSGNENGNNINKVFTAKVGERLINIDYKDIMFFETSTTVHKVILHGQNRQLEFYGQMKELEETLGDSFVRCHRAFIVNKNNINEIDKLTRVAVMKNGEECLISSRYLAKLVKK